MWQFFFSILDAGIVALVIFLSKFLKCFADNYNGGILQHLSNNFPKTLKGATRLLGIGRDNFVKYIVCPLCNSVFDHEFGYILQDGHKVPRHCPHVGMPNHPSWSQRQPCGSSLMRVVKSSG